MAKDFRNFTAVLNIENYDSDRAAELLSGVLHIKKKVCDDILTSFEKWPVGMVNGILSITQWKCIKKAIEKKIAKVGISCKVRDICINKTGRHSLALAVSVECTYSDILGFVMKQIENKRNYSKDSIDALIVGIIDESDESIPDNVKDNFLKKFVNSRSRLLCDICEKQLEKKCNLKVTLSGIELQIKNSEKI